MDESRNAKRCSQSKPSVQSNCKRDQKEGDQPGNHLLIVSAHRKASSRLRPMVVINRGQTATARSVTRRRRSAVPITYPWKCGTHSHAKRIGPA